MQSNVRSGVIYPDPKTLEARRSVATDCIKKLGLKLPTLIDGMDNAMMKTYNAWPNRVCIIGGDGLIEWVGLSGPWGVSRAKFEDPLKRLLALPGGGRFTEHAPKLVPLNAKALGNADLRAPDGYEPVRASGGFAFANGRTGGASYQADPATTLKKARAVLEAIGITSGLGKNEQAYESSLDPIRANGQVSKARQSKLYRVRYEHLVGNVRVAGDHVDVVLDMLGVREIRGAWHGIAGSAQAGEGERVSSLAAAKKGKMLESVARLLYVPGKAEDGRVALRPTWRLTKGRKTLDVEAVK
jgi:hypothetical protein